VRHERHFMQLIRSCMKNAVITSKSAYMHDGCFLAGQRVTGVTDETKRIGECEERRNSYLYMRRRCEWPRKAKMHVGYSDDRNKQ